MDFSKINIEGVLIGSLIGLFIKTVFDRVSTALKLNRQRKVIIDYSSHIGASKTLKYINDLDFAKNYILADTTEKIMKIKSSNPSVDAMPMFTSSVFKSFSQDELRRTTYSTKNYIAILDITYSIDFFREYMPLQLLDKYHHKVRKHMEDENVKPEDEIKHFQECGVLKALAKNAVEEIEMKKDRAVLTHQHFHDLIENLKGWWPIWILKYIVRQ